MRSFERIPDIWSNYSVNIKGSVLNVQMCK